MLPCQAGGVDEAVRGTNHEAGAGKHCGIEGGVGKDPNFDVVPDAIEDKIEDVVGGIKDVAGSVRDSLKKLNLRKK